MIETLQRLRTAKISGCIPPAPPRLRLRQFGLESEIWQVRASYDQKPYRKIMIEMFGGTVHPSPSDLNAAGRAITNYALGSVLK